MKREKGVEGKGMEGHLLRGSYGETGGGNWKGKKKGLPPYFVKGPPSSMLRHWYS